MQWTKLTANTLPPVESAIWLWCMVWRKPILMDDFCGASLNNLLRRENTVDPVYWALAVPPALPTELAAALPPGSQPELVGQLTGKDTSDLPAELVVQMTEANRLHVKIFSSPDSVSADDVEQYDRLMSGLEEAGWIGLESLQFAKAETTEAPVEPELVPIPPAD